MGETEILYPLEICMKQMLNVNGCYWLGGEGWFNCLDHIHKMSFGFFCVTCVLPTVLQDTVNEGLLCSQCVSAFLRTVFLMWKQIGTGKRSSQPDSRHVILSSYIYCIDKICFKLTTNQTVWCIVRKGLKTTQSYFIEKHTTMKLCMTHTLSPQTEDATVLVYADKHFKLGSPVAGSSCIHTRH